MKNEEREQQDERLKEAMSHIKHKIMVLSGKGGVGKSTVAVNLAYGLAMNDKQVGIVDVDIHGPNVPKMLGIDDRTFTGSENRIDPVEVLPNLKVASIALAGYGRDDALIWRGPLKIGVIKQFLADVNWGDLDYLVIDSPPGTGDEPLTVGQVIPDIDGAVIVTTPQEVSVLDSRKTINFAKKLNVPVLGVIENMSGFICPHCGEEVDIFSKGGGEKAASEMDVSYLGNIPLDPNMVVSGDGGRAYIQASPEAPAAKRYMEIIEELSKKMEG
ncbi:MAG: Mrp/NBP35 family ATP-binding protein [Spirochaetales bacterium]|nr:Mrp/NBP35 family ATP-binding protein [Spirochaetales bacterium]MCF7937158.1 Mrp/NBP35 family ATP-binding protein [Spirochaetales bacterium]